MPYGIELRNSEGGVIADEVLNTMIVVEQGSIAVADYAGSSSVDGTFRSQATINLTGTYTTPPIIAMQPVLSGRQVVQPFPINTGTSQSPNFNRFFLRNDTRLEYRWIALVSSASAAGAALTASGDYGLQTRDASGNVLFDSRWSRLAALTHVMTFNDIVVGVNPNGAFLPAVATPQSVTIPANNTNAWFCLSPVYGRKRIPTLEQIIRGRQVYSGGGDFIPALTQVDATTVSQTAIRIGSGEIYTGGTPPANDITNYGGLALVFRYSLHS